jgi:hypothetical protein
VSEITCCRYEDFVKVLADETRQSILELLKDREMSVGEIVVHFRLTQPTIRQCEMFRLPGLPGSMLAPEECVDVCGPATLWIAGKLRRWNRV